MSGISSLASPMAIYSIEETYDLMFKKNQFPVPWSSAVCYDDSECIAFRREAYGTLHPGSCRTIPCQYCNEGKRREIALHAIRPLPTRCKYPGCGEVIDETDNISGYCRSCCCRAKNTSKDFLVSKLRSQEKNIVI